MNVGWAAYAGRPHWAACVSACTAQLDRASMTPTHRQASLPRRRWLRAIARGAAAAWCGGGLWRAVAAEPTSARPSVTPHPSDTALHKIMAEDLPITGEADEALASLDRMMAAFVTLYDIPGAALAVAREGRLVYARGFGYADRERGEAVQPHTLFRVASISKPVTAAAVFRLVEQGKLHLSDRAFEIVDLAPHLAENAAPDTRLREITIEQLLQHTAGWDRNATFDPMFRSVEIAQALGTAPPANTEQIIRYMLGRPLDFAPGTRMAYSNFGYCVLGRVIERAAGRSYEDFVRAEVLGPLGIRRMRLGRTLREHRAPDEACYYDAFNRTGPAVMGHHIGAPVPLPYGAWCLESMDAHGGWIASAPELVRFAAAFDLPDACPFFGPPQVRAMFARPPAGAGYEPDGQPRAAYYACGWNVRPVEGGINTWHGGALDGTAAWLVRRADRTHWAVVFNTMQAPHGTYLGELVDFYGHHAISKVSHWPEVDYFSEL